MAVEQTSPMQPAEIATGPAAAAILAVGVGTFVLGLLATLNEASQGIHDFLEFNTRVGPLSGKTIFAAIAYFGAWLLLTGIYRGKSPRLAPILSAAGGLVVLGLIGTFPTFFEAFASE